MQIRPMRAEDFDSVKEIVQQVHTLHLHNRPDIYNAVDPLDKKYFDFLLSDENTLTLVAQAEGKAVGLCVVTLRAPSENPIIKARKVAYMEDLCVEERYRRCGIGKKLFCEMRTLAQQKGAQALELMVWSFNKAAIRFYESVGLTPRSIMMEEKL